MHHIFLFATTGKHMARMPKMASKKISLARGVHCCPYLFFFNFILPDKRLYIVRNMFIHTYDCVNILYELPLLPNNTASATF